MKKMLTCYALRQAIREAGFVPQLRDQQYRFRELPGHMRQQVLETARWIENSSYEYIMSITHKFIKMIEMPRAARIFWPMFVIKHLRCLNATNARPLRGRKTL
ncbi:MAG: hypothetical protein SFV52_07400 [Saprospiraceae bacterium]|nr:hypothetical protein [Saprospiraceae bacterium]